MKQLNWLATATTALVLALGLVACGKTKNNSDNASTPASVCTRSWDGTMRDQYGRNCGNYATNSCLNTSYNPATGQYVDISTGAPVNCANTYNGTGAIP